MRPVARLVLLGFFLAVLLLIGHGTARGASEATFGAAEPVASTDLSQGAGQWTASVLSGDRASAEVLDPPGGAGAVPATAAIRNEATLTSIGLLEGFLKFIGAGSSYSQTITVAEATNMEEVEQCWGGTTCVHVDTGANALLIFGGTTAWRLTFLSDTAAASAEFLVEPTIRSFTFDVAVVGLQFLLTLAGTDCFGTALLSNPDHLDSLLLLTAQVTPEFSGVAEAIADSRFRDAAQEFVGAVVRAAPHVAVVLGGIIAQDATVAALCSAVHAKITGLTAGLWLLIRAGVFIAQKIPLAINYVANVLLADDPSTEIGVFYQPSGRAPPGITPEPPEEEEPPVVECPPSENVDVSLIIDSSGSMSSSDSTDQRLAAAEVFANNAFNGDSVAVIDFDDSVRVAQPITLLSADRSSLISSIRTIDSDGQTDIGGGIRLAYQELSGSVSPNRKAGILLTDGMHNTGSYGDAHSSFASSGWPIYVIGLGQPGSDLDPDFLNRIAADTGTDQYVQLTDPNELTRIYFDIARQQKCGLDRLDDSMALAQGESRDVTANIPPRQTSASFLASWPGSTVDLSLVDPSGRQIGPDTQEPDIFHAKGLTYELYRIDDPDPGDWVMKLFGRDLPAGSETVTVQSASIPQPQIEIASPPLRELAVTKAGGIDYTVPAAATAVVVALLVAGGGFWVFSTTGGPVGTLMLAGPGQPPLPVRIGRRTRIITIGRARSNDIVIDDPYVSRAHARIRRMGDVYVIEDLGSTGGTLLNGSPTRMSPLADGDIISIGESRLTFRIEPRGNR